MRLLVGALCVLLVAPAAWAGGKRELKKQAAAHKKAGLAHFEKGEFDQAVEKLQLAYGLSEEAGLLFHIGRAYEAKKDAPQAVYYYTTFLEKAGKDKRKAEAQARIDALKGAPAATKPDPEPPPQPDPEPPPQPDPEPLPQPEPQPEPVARPTLDPEPIPDEPRGKRGMSGGRIAGIAIAGAGVAAIAAGAYFAKVAADKADEISTVFDEGRPWSPAYDDLYDDGESAATTAKILLIGGGAALVGGGLLFFLSGNSDSSTPVSVAPTRGGAQVSFSCDF